MSAESSGVVKLADTISELLYGVAGWLLFGLGMIGLIVTMLRVIGDPTAMNLAASTVVALFSILFIIFGVFVNPRFRRRLHRRHSITRFGRTKSVDNRVLRSNEGRIESCTECETQQNKGLIRRYREEYLLAGIPVYTLLEGHNYYCPDCTTTGVSSHPQTNESTDEYRDNSKPVKERAREQN